MGKINAGIDYAVDSVTLADLVEDYRGGNENPMFTFKNAREQRRPLGGAVLLRKRFYSQTFAHRAPSMLPSDAGLFADDRAGLEGQQLVGPLRRPFAQLIDAKR